MRRRCEKVKVEESIYSKWSPLAGVEVETTLIPWGKGHIRRHVIHSNGEYEVYESGFAIPVLDRGELNKVYEGKRIKLFHEKAYSSITLREGEGVLDSVQCETSTNILHPKVSLPFVKFTIKQGTTKIETYIEGDLI